MAEDKIKSLYDAFVNDGYEMEPLDEFRKNLADGKKRRAAYDALVNDGYEMEPFDEFEQNLGFGQQQSAAQPPSTPTGQAELQEFTREVNQWNQPTPKGYARDNAGRLVTTRAGEGGSVYATPVTQTPEEQAMQQRMSQVGEIYLEPEAYSFEPDAGDGKMHYSWRNGRRIGQLDPGALRFAHIGRNYSSEAYNQAEQEAAEMTDEQLIKAFNDLYSAYGKDSDNALTQGYGRDDASRMMAYATEMRYRDVGMGHARDYGHGGQPKSTGVYHYHAAKMDPAVSAEMDRQDNMSWDARVAYLSEALRDKQARENTINIGRGTDEDRKALEADRRKLLAGSMLYARDNNRYPEEAYNIVVGAANNAMPTDTGFWNGFTSTMGQMWRDVKYFTGEAANLIADDRGDVIDAIEALDKYGEDAETKLVAGTLHNMGLLGMLMFDGDEAGASEGAGRVLAGCIVRSKDGRVDIDATRAALLRKLKTTYSWGDRQMRDNVYNTAMAKRVEGDAAWWGQQVAQLVPSAAAVAVGVTTRNPAAAQAIGQLGMGYMCISSGSQAMQEARLYGANENQVWTAGIVNAMLEYATEKIPFDRYTRRVFGEVKATSARRLMDAVADVNHPAHREVQQLLEAARKELGNGTLVKAYTGDILAEGSSEFAAGTLQKASEILYKNPEDYPTFMEILEEGIEGFKGGAAMGGIMGGISTGTTYFEADNRRKKAGRVTVGLYDRGDGMGVPIEIVGHDSNGNYVAIDGQHNEVIVKPDEVQGVTTYTYDEWKKGEAEQRQDQSFNEGYQASDEEQAGVKERVDVARQRLRDLGFNDYQIDYLEGLDEQGMLDEFSEMEGWEGEGADAAREFLNARAAYEGMLQHVQDDMEGAIAESEAEVDQQTHPETGAVHHAVLKTGGEVWVVGGNVALTPEGNIDIENSDGDLIVLDPATGGKRMIHISDLASADEPVMADQLKQDAAATIQETMATDASNRIDGVLPFQPGDVYSDLPFGDETHTVQVIADGEDGVNVVVSIDGGEQTLMPMQMIQEAADAQREARIAEQAAVAGTAAQPQPTGQEDAAPADDEASQSDAIPEQEAVEEEQPDEDAMPMNGDEVDWFATSPERGHRFLYDEAGLSPEEADAVVANSVKDAEKELEKVSKKAPKPGNAAQLNKYRAEKEAHEQQVAAAQAAVDYWKGVQATQEAIRQQAEAELLAQRAEEGKQRSEAAAQTEAEKEAQRLADREAARQEREALNGVPDVVNDKPEDARARGFRNVNGERVDRQLLTNSVGGRTGSVKFSTDVTVPSRIAVIEADELQPSHIEGQRNPLFFLDEAQPKNRTDQASDVAAEKIAKNINPEEITGDGGAYQFSAPTVNERGEVVQGNNRSSALKRMWSSGAYAESQQRYKQYLIDHAEEFGLNPQLVASMNRPVMVNEISVDDAEAIRLGQMSAKDLESGGIERIDPVTTARKLGPKMRNFASVLLSGEDENMSLAELIAANGEAAVKWLADRGVISPTQVQSAWNTAKTGLTAEAKLDLQNILRQQLFQGGVSDLPHMFEAMPAKAQKAILSTFMRDMDSADADRILPELQHAIEAWYGAASGTSDFSKATNYEAASRAMLGWTNVRNAFSGVLPSEKFSKFAIELANRLQGSSMRNMVTYFNEFYDLVQGTGVGDLFGSGVSGEKLTLAEAIAKIFNVDINETNNGQERSEDVGSDRGDGQEGRQGEPGDAAGTEPAAPGAGTPERGGRAESNDQSVAKAEAEVDTEPTDGQKEAGNYKKGHVKIDGFDVTIEQPKGSVRSGVDASGKAWSQEMHNTYGYIRGTEGVDGDHIDVFLSDHLDNWNGMVYVVDQVNKDGSFDEHKVMYGFDSEQEARDAYLSNYEEGWTGLGNITGVTRDEFKKWVDSSHRKTKPFAEYKSVKVSRPIQGLEGYTEDEILADVRAFIEEQLEDAGIEGVTIKDMALHGSRMRGDARPDSDLDVVVEYEGDISEDAFFNLVNYDLNFRGPNGVIIDINPITRGKSGTLEQYMERSRRYDEEKRAATAETTEPVQSTDTVDQAYTITPTKYTTKKNKELDVWLVKFSGEIDKKQATEIAKETRGWWDREQGGFLMRSEEAARDLAERVAGTTSQSDAIPEQPAEDANKSYEDAISAEVDHDLKMQEKYGTPNWIDQAADEDLAERDRLIAEREKAINALQGNKPAETGNKPAKTNKKPGKRSAYVEQQIDAIARELASREVVQGTIDTMPRVEDMMAPFSDWISQYVAEHYSDMENPDHVDVLHEFFGYNKWSPKDNTDRTFKALSDVIKRTKEIVKQNKQAQAAASENASKPASEEPKAGPKRLVSDDRMAELKERLRKKLGGQLNVGVDPELLAIGAELAVGHIERGLTKFADYAKAMLEDVGDVIRPYLKSFYNAVREMPEAEEYADAMTPYDEVRKFDIANFDKEGPKDVVATAKSIVDEQKVEKDVVEVTEKAKKTSKKKKKDVSSQQVLSLFDLVPEETRENNEPSKQENNGSERTDESRPEGLPADSDNEGEPTGRVGQADRQESGGSDRGGQESRGGGLREHLHDGLRLDEQLTEPSPKLNQNNNHVERGKDYAPKDVDARVEANIAAIELMKKLIESGKKATPKEMTVLRKFSGWGGLGKAFNESAYGWREDGVPNRLRKLLGEEGYQQAVMSRNSAYYTPAKVIDIMWDIARALGFKGGNVLEGSAGIGNILGLMPTDMSERSRIHAVEIDSTTGNILSLLYPDAKVEIQGFEETRVQNGTVDLSITNVPFVTGLHVIDTSGDKDLSKKFRDIHDFCIAKNVRKLREGGIGIFITSSGTLDNSQKLRDWIVSEGNSDVVGAFRLNNSTFGGTAATSDIIVVRKRVNGQKSPNAIDVSTVTGVRTVEHETGEYKTVKGKQVAITKPMTLEYNRYFVEHPEMMGGEMAFGFEKGETYRETSKALYTKRGINQDERLRAFVEDIASKDWSSETAAQPRPMEQEETVYEELGEGVKEGSMLVDGKGQLCVARYGQAVPLEVNANKVKGRTKAQCFQDYCAIKDTVNAVLDYQTEHDDDADLQPLLDKLNKVFDDFVNTYGHFHKNTALSFLKNDMDFSSIAALEDMKERNDEHGKRVRTFKKSDIFNKRVVEKETEPKPTTIKDGVITSIYKFGRVDVPYISEQLGMGADEVKATIVQEGLGFENPMSREIEVSYEYLSGNVREKLRQAIENNEDGQYDANVKALEAVIPMNIPAHLIEFTLGSSWLDPKLYSDFIKERTGVNARVALIGGTWIVDVPGYYFTEQNRAMGVESEMCGKVVYGHELIAAALQNKTVRVSKTTKFRDGGSETIVDKVASQACATKIDEIRQDFKDWAREKMQSDPDMSAQVEEVYNESFNNYVPREIPDSFVPDYFGGASHHIKLRPHQAKAAIRATTQNVMLAHEVGTGKTFTLITTAMEMRRLGTARKPMIVVQNATVGQFVASAKELYPKAKVLTLEDADRTAEGRKAFYAKIKYNDWDMIVIPQSAFEMIPDSEERQMNFVRDKIDEKMLVLEQMEKAGVDTKSMAYKQAEREVEKLEEELNIIAGAASEKRKQRDEKREAKTRQNAAVQAREMLDRKVDDVEDFDQMGIDAILVDEAHEYKHLGFATAMQRGVKGVDPSYSKKSQGVFLKCQAVMERTGGKNVVFATGTPISNTAAEIWNFMRYLYPAETLKDYGIYYFDDFVRNFGNISQMLEFATNGRFKENNRFAGYVNLPELVRIWSGVSDTVLTDEASDLKTKIPEMEGGKAQDIYLPQTRALRSVMKYVNAELERYENMSGKEKKENSHIPLTMYGIAKAAAVDARLVLQDAEDEPNSKTNEAVRQTLKSLEDTASYRGTVAIFADNYQNKQSGFNLYEDIRKKLIDAGVPADQIVVMKSGMSVNKKLEIFDKVNAGEIRVIMGSTFTLGTGVNIQERLHTLIHVDAPNRPMDYTQRNGRILRQGNIHKEMGKPVRVLRFGVEDSLDVTAYQRLKTKGAIADSIMHGKAMMSDSMENRTMEEDEDVFGDVVAQLSGSEYALLKNQAEREVRKLEAKRKQYEADQIYIHSQKPRLAGYIRASRQAKAEAEAALKALEGVDMSAGITVGKQHFNNADEMGDFIKEYNKKITEDMDRIRKSFMSEDTVREMTMSIGGFDFNVRTVMARDTEKRGTTLSYVTRRTMSYTCEALGLTEPVPVKQGLLRNAIEDIMQNVLTGKDARERVEAAESSIARNEHELEVISEREGRPFEQADELKEARAKLKDYEQLMKAELEAKEAKYADIDASVDAASPVEADDEDVLLREEDVRVGNAQYNDNTDLQLREALVEGGRLAIMERDGKWRVEGMPGEFNSRYAALDEWRERAAGNVVWYLSDDGDYIEVEGDGDMYETVSRTTTTSGRKRRERMARQQATRSASGRRMVDELADKLGVKVRYVDDMTEEERAQFSERQLRSKGWYNPRTGEVFINLGRHTRLYDILSTFLHETVAHKGLRRLFGKDFNAFVDNVYNNVNKGIRAEIDRMAEQQKSRATEAQRARHDDEHWRRVATEEYMAKLAERLNLNHPEERTIWEKIKGFLLDKLRKIGVTVADSLSDNDLRGILWESYHSMESEGVMGYAKGVAFRDQMEREANNRGRAAAHGTSIIAAEPKAQYTGSLFDVLPQAGAWARMMSNMSERELFSEMAQDGPNVTSSYSEEYDRRHIKEYNQACDEIQAQLERELPGEDRLLELLQDAEAQWADGAYKDSRRTGVLAAIDTISRALDEERADLPRVEEDVQAEGSQYTNSGGVGLLGESDEPYNQQRANDIVRDFPHSHAVKEGFAAFCAVDSEDALEQAIADNHLTDEEAEDLREKYNDPGTLGCALREGKNLIAIFTHKLKSLKDLEEVNSHETMHIAYGQLGREEHNRFNNAILNWFRSKSWGNKFIDALQAEHDPKDWADETMAYFVGHAVKKHGWKKFFSGKVNYGNEEINNFVSRIKEIIINEEEFERLQDQSNADAGRNGSRGRAQRPADGNQDDEDVRYRDDEDLLFNDSDDDDGTIGAYNRAVNTMGKTMRVAGRDFKPRMTRYNFQEAFQDAILSVKKLQQVVCEAHGLDKLPSKEDAWTYENRLSSINMHARKHFIEKLYEPMMKAHDKLVKHGATVDEITEYVICKHGLERNQVFAERDAQRDADEIARNGGVPDIDALRDQYRQRDYSGLTSITGLDNIADIEADAQRRVDEFEQKHGQLCDELWSRINDATKWTLRRSYDGGMMSAQTYIKVRDMFQYYVPLRGWDETTAEDVYDYIMGDRGAFNGTLKAAMGRTSLADDPFATIGNMGESAIVQGNRNHLKQRLWNMATNHPTDVCKVRDMWVVLDAQGEWIADFPEIPEDADADTIAMILDDHETAMLDLESQDLAKRVRNNLDVGYRIDQRYIPEHAVVVMMNGDRHVVYINGNPRAAQAINGNLSSDKGSKNAIRRLVDFVFKDTRRYYSSVVTSYNINFSGANFVRDLPHAYAMTFTKYGWRKAAKYIVKSFQCIPWVIKNQAGYSGNSNMDQLFREFVAYGGVTGYAHINDIDSWKADNRRRMARLNALGKGTVGTLKGIKAVIHAVGWFSETLELIPRFTTYCASRDMGMDIQSSIKEAKDITTNFNKKGTEMTPGVWGAVANTLRYTKMFFNPIVQGMYQWFDVAKDSKAAKARLTGIMLWMPAMGALIPYLNQFLLAAIGGDDDDDYFLQNEFTRRQNMLIWTGNGYAKIPIAPVFRELYGMGETIATRMCGRIDDMKMAADFVDQLRAAFSLEGQTNYREWSIARAISPEQYAPIVDIMNNENFTGKSLWYESEWNKTKPEYTKAKESTWSPLVNISRTINGWLGGDEDIAADKSGKWLNPVVWQHLLTNYGGGFAQVIGDASSTINNLAHGEATDVSQWPIAKRFYTQPTEKRANWARYGIYKQYEIEFNKAKDKFAALKKRGLSPLDMAKEISEFAQRHPKAVGVYASWNGGINGADYVQKLKDLREKGDDAAYWATLKEAVEKADYAMRTGYAKAWEQKRPSRPEFLDDDELHSTFDNSENDSVRAVMAKEIATRGGVQDYFSHDPYENYGDEATAYWNTYRRLRISEDVVEDGKASQLLDDNEKETLKKIKKQLGQGGDDEQIMDEYRRERRRLIEEHDNE